MALFQLHEQLQSPVPRAAADDSTIGDDVGLQVTWTEPVDGLY